MLRLVGIDLAGRLERPTGWALLMGRKAVVKELHADHEILFETVKARPALVAVDAPLTLPAHGALRRADRDMRRRGYPVLPPLFPGMKELTLRAIRLTEELRKEQVLVIEVHPTSTRRALQMPLKDWRRIQEVFVEMGLGVEWGKRALTPHEADAITAALTALLHVKEETESIGGPREGFIVVPAAGHWRKCIPYFISNWAKPLGLYDDKRKAYTPSRHDKAEELTQNTKTVDSEDRPGKGYRGDQTPPEAQGPSRTVHDIPCSRRRDPPDSSLRSR